MKKALLLLFLSCSIIGFAETGQALHAGSLAFPAATITVMTRNLYAGASFRILAGTQTPSDLPDRVARIYAKILSSEFPRRAEAIADEIVQNQPDVIALQEVPLVIRFPEVSMSGERQSAEIRIDYLEILLKALEHRHANYAIAAKVNNTEVIAPSTNGDKISYTDRDVILVRLDPPGGGMLVFNPQAKNFDKKATLEVAGDPVSLRRSWCSIDVMIRGKMARIVNTHLEEDFFDLIQFLQADELLTGPFQTDLPLIVLGDFNAAETSATYKYILKAGFKDSWPLVQPEDPGFSCCQDEDLLNPTSQLKERIDLVLFRGDQINVHDAKLVGASSSNRMTLGQWPSDHAGVVAKLSIN